MSTTKPSASKVSTTKAPPTKAASKARQQKAPPVGRPVVRKPPPTRKGKSIVNQKQTPWGLIAATAAVVLFAVAIVVVVIVTHKSDNAAGGKCSKQIGNNSTSYLNENACAKAINGVTSRPEPKRNHVQGVIKYDSTPPVGGNHSQYWADCTGTVYPHAIANENAVHMLEHGAVWITYNAKTLSPSGLNELKRYVSGQDRMALSPYPDLKAPDLACSRGAISCSCRRRPTRASRSSSRRCATTR